MSDYFAAVADLHCHRWSMFSSIDKDGVNSRLRTILAELKRAAEELIAAGGKTLVIAGDVNHVRGSLDPEVLNPVQDTVRWILDQGINIFILPGNHDLAGKETTALGSSVQTLAETFSQEANVTVVNTSRLFRHAVPHTSSFAFVPWCSSTRELMEHARDLAAQARAVGCIKQTDLFIHAGIDGVLKNMPDHGLSANMLAALGFRRVWAGHYHNAKDLGGGVRSIGALTHHTWSDVDSSAGFWIADDKSERFFTSTAPRFEDATGLDLEDMKILAAGNYVRFRGEEMEPAAVKDLREFLTNCGALGVSIQVTRQTANKRAASPAKALTLTESVSAFIDTTKLIPAHLDREAIRRSALDVLALSQASLD